MLDWLKNLSRGRPYKNSVGLDESSLRLLAEDLDALEKLDPDLPLVVLRFVLDGEGDEALLRLGATPGTGAALGFRGPVRGVREPGESVRSRFFECVCCVDPKFFIRLGKTYEAATGFAKANLLAQSPRLAGQLSQQSFNDPRLDWLELLLMEATQLNLHSWPRNCRPCAALTAEMVEQILKVEGYPPELLHYTAFQPKLERFGSPPFELVFQTMTGFAESAVRHKQVMLEALSHADFKQRVYALTVMRNCKVPSEPIVGRLVELALEQSKQVREQAELLLADIKPAATPMLKRKIARGENEERVGAARLLWEWGGSDVREFLEARLSDEKNKRVAQSIRDLLDAPVLKSESSVMGSRLHLPPLDPIEVNAALGSETERAWTECFEKVNIGVTQLQAAKSTQYHIGELKSAASGITARAFAGLQNGDVEPILSGLSFAGWNKETNEPLKSFWQRSELRPIHLVRFLMQVGALKPGREHDPRVLSYGFWLETLVPVFHRTHPDSGLREFGAAFAAAGLDPSRIGKGLLARMYAGGVALGIPHAQIWPYWAEHLDLLERAFAPGPGDFMERYYHRHARINAFEALASFPEPPENLVPLLWNLALGPKSERLQAQRALEKSSTILHRLTAALNGGSSESRLAAAEWLGRLGDKSVIAPLQAAIKREKNESTKGAMMGALEQLGVPVEQFLDRDGLLEESIKGLTKAIPEDLKWFPFEQLPTVHWDGSGKLVEPEIVRWWVVQGFKLKNPEPGPLLRKYCASLKTTDREALGQFVLTAWIGEDISPISATEAEARAKSNAQQSLQWIQQFQQSVQNNPAMAQQMAAYAPQIRTYEELYQAGLAMLQRQPKGSAISSKGVLSLAGACGGAESAPVVGRYLKEWYGMRAGQCRALLQMLAWVEHKTATQLLLAVGSRFRTKSIQEEASKQAQSLAERKGWTVAELADRTIPAAGMDDDGVLALDFGPRQFTARLNEDLEFTLVDSDSKPLKSLPEPRKDDDEAKSAEAKKAFSAAKKELKSVVAMQRDRFYEAMCTQRTWPFEDWNLYLNRHPIARHHCQRLVWAVIRDEKVASLFRPLPDGSLTDAADDPVTLQPDDLVRVAHECQVTPEQSKVWRQHLKDYEAEPLFEQFGRLGFDLTEECKQEEELLDFRGHVLEAFKLRGRASKLGFTRGQTQDGGWFYDYRKRFPTLGIEAVIEFSGNGLPEENRTVALITMRFERVAPEGEPVIGGAKLPLGEVPSVLLTECWNDIRQIAAEGSGFDAEWEKKTQV